MNGVCQVYTSLFNIEREKVDGRSIIQYQEWLRKTLDIFPSILVFHDGTCSDMNLPTQNLILVDKKNLEAFSYREKVIELLKVFKPIAPQDVTFNLPDYSLVQFSKFELALMAHRHSNAQSVLWVDAGISRFLHSPRKSSKKTFYRFEKQSKKLLEHQISMVLEIDIFNNFIIKELKLAQSEIGSCRRVISGTSFWMNSQYLSELNTIISREIRNWLNLGIWDNEQVLLRNVISKLSNIKFVPQIFAETGGVARKMLNCKIGRLDLLDNLIIKALK